MKNDLDLDSNPRAEAECVLIHCFKWPVNGVEWNMHCKPIYTLTYV